MWGSMSDVYVYEMALNRNVFKFVDERSACQPVRKDHKALVRTSEMFDQDRHLQFVNSLS
jgi:hypothetical protein